MNTRLGISLGALCIVAQVLYASQLSGQTPPAITVPGESVVAIFHAEGAQIYECKHDQKNKLFWMLREPVATLILDGKTIGFHFAGPSWQHIDGSSVRAHMVSAAPGATFSDIPWLKLEATGHGGDGVLSRVAMVQRINTKGGAVQGSCETAGVYRSVPYSADYVFLRKRG
jgi:uncharacterized protein DUF3455